MDPVALAVKPPNPTANLGEIMNVANGVMQFKRAQATLPYAAPMAAAQTARAQTESQAAKFHLSTEQVQKGAQILGGLVRDPAILDATKNPTGAVEALTGAQQQMQLEGITPAQANVLTAHAVHLAAHAPATLPGFLATLARTAMGPEAQVTASEPAFNDQNTGANIIRNQVNPFYGPTGVTAVTPLQPSPTTPVYNATTQSMQYAGSPPVQATGSQAVPGGLQPQAAYGAPASAPLGVPQDYAALGTQTAQDFAAVTHAANRASQSIPVLEIAREYAGDAEVSVGATQRTMVAGIAGLLGIKPAEMAKTSTDIMTKNLAMVLGGDTDMARQLSALANPHQTMTKAALMQTSDEVIAQLEMVKKESAYLQQYVTNPVAYQQAKAKFAQINNFRLIQFMQRREAGDLTGAKKILDSLKTQAQKDQFLRQGQEALTMGILP